MSEQPPYPSQPSYGSGQPPAQSGPPPRAVDLAVKLIWVGIALTILGAIITFVSLDTVVDRALEDTGASAADADAARVGVVVGALIGLFIGVGVFVVLAIFIGKRHNWARIVYTVLAALGVLFSVFGMFGTQPIALVLIDIVQLLLTVAVVVLLWRPEANAWFSAPR